MDLPLLKEHVLVGLLLVFLLGLTQYGVPSLLQVNTYPVEVFIQFGAHFDHASGAVLAIPLIVCSLVAVGFLSRLLVSRGTVVSLSFRSSRLFEMTAAQKAASSAVLSIVFLLLVGTPVLQLAKTTGSLESVWAALKTSWEPILFSCQIALFSCILTPMLALCVLMAEDRVSAGTRNILRFLWVLPLGVPPVLYGLGFIAGWNRPGLQWLYQGSGVVVLAMVAMFFPISEEILRAARSQVSQRYSEAADTSALSPWLKLRKIWLPLLRPGLAAAAAITFLFGFRELGASLLILPPGKETVSLKIYSLVHYGAHQLVSALCLILIAVTALVVGLMSWWGDREYA